MLAETAIAPGEQARRRAGGGSAYHRRVKLTIEVPSRTLKRQSRLNHTWIMLALDGRPSAICFRDENAMFEHLKSAWG